MSAALSKVPPFKILDWRPVAKNSLKGFASVGLPSGMIVSDIAVHERDGKAWASPPSKPMLDRAGQPMRDDAGKARWTNLITFVDRKTQTAWSDGVVAALRDQRPEVLA